MRGRDGVSGESWWTQRRVSVSGRTARLPGALLVLALGDLVWEVVKANLGAARRADWPWRLTVLDASTCAAVVALLAGIVVTRAQFSQTARPVLSWSGYVGHSRVLPGSARTVCLVNAGGGRAVTHSVRYRIRAVPDGDHGVVPDGGGGVVPAGWVTWHEAVAALRALGLDGDRDGGEDFFLLHLGTGAALPPADSGGGPGTGVELLALGARALERLAALDIRVEVKDVLGDVYGRDLQCVRPVGAPGRPSG